MQRLTMVGLGGVSARGGVVNITAQGGMTLTGQVSVKLHNVAATAILLLFSDCDHQW